MIFSEPELFNQGFRGCCRGLLANHSPFIFSCCNRAGDNVEAGVTDGLLSSCTVLLKVWKALALLRSFLVRFFPHHSMNKRFGLDALVSEA